MILENHDALLQQVFIASSLISVILLILSVAVLQGKRVIDNSVAPLQMMALGLLLFIVFQQPLTLELVGEKVQAIMTAIALVPWLLGTSQFASGGLPAFPRKFINFLAASSWCAAALTAAGLILKQNNQTSLDIAITTILLIFVPLMVIGLLSILFLLLPKSMRPPKLTAAMLGNLIFCFIHLLAGLAVLDYQLESTTHSMLASSINFLSQEMPYLFKPQLIHVAYLITPLLFCINALYLPTQGNLSLSRNMALYTTIAVIFSAFIGAMWYLSTYAASSTFSNSTSIGVILILLTSVGASYIALSTNVRNNLRVAIDKNFFRHKYDYRKVWLELIQNLSTTDPEEDFSLHSLKAIAGIFSASGGALWLKTNNRQFVLTSNWNIDSELPTTINEKELFLQPFKDEGWIYSLNKSGEREHDRHLRKLPEWISSIEDVWIVAPLMRGEETVGFFLLQQKENNQILMWEDIDVIKSAGIQLASHISSQMSAEELARARQFDTYNKLTAFIMHDLKNLIAQQALVVENAKKHKENPAFVEDAVRTIDNSVGRMNQLLKRLKSNSQNAAPRSIIVKELVTDAIRKSADRSPIPTLRGTSELVSIVADKEQITMIILHVIRNAQDATPDDGFIDVTIHDNKEYTTIEIEDNGCGMDEEFIQHRLFKPFDSTKSTMGMGIGAYQAKEFIEQMGGEIDIASQVNLGTTVRIQLPTSNRELRAG